MSGARRPAGPRIGLVVALAALGSLGCGRGESSDERPPLLLVLQVEGLDRYPVEFAQPPAASTGGDALSAALERAVPAGWGARQAVDFETGDTSAAGLLATLTSGVDACVHGLLSARDLGAHRAAPEAPSAALRFREAGWDTRGHSALDWLAVEHSGPQVGFESWTASGGGQAPDAALAQLARALEPRPTLAVAVLELPLFEGRALPLAAARELRDADAFGEQAELVPLARAGDREAWAQLVASFARRRGSRGHAALAAAVAAADVRALAGAVGRTLGELEPRYRPLGLAILHRRPGARERCTLELWTPATAPQPPRDARGLAGWLAELGGLVAAAESPAAALDACDPRSLRGLVIDFPAGSGGYRLRLRGPAEELLGARVESLVDGTPTLLEERAADRRGELSLVVDARDTARRVAVEATARAVEWRLDWTPLGDNPAPLPVEVGPQGEGFAPFVGAGALGQTGGSSGAGAPDPPSAAASAAPGTQGSPAAQGSTSPGSVALRATRGGWSRLLAEPGLGPALPPGKLEDVFLSSSDAIWADPGELGLRTFKIRLIPGVQGEAISEMGQAKFVPRIRWRGPRLSPASDSSARVRARAAALPPFE